MPERIDYQASARAFLESISVTFKAELIGNGNDCPLWCDGSHIHGKNYRITFHRTTGFGKWTTGDFVIEFWNSYADAKKRKVPQPYDVLACLQKGSVGTFKEFCSDFGYKQDNQLSKGTYRAVSNEWSKVRAFFTASEIEQLQEIN